MPSGGTSDSGSSQGDFKATALNVSYMAEQTALFGIVVGIALVITGIGLIVIAYAVFVRRPGEEAQAA